MTTARDGTTTRGIAISGSPLMSPRITAIQMKRYGQRHEHPRAPIDLNAQDREALIKAHAAMIHIAKLAPAGHGGIDIAGEHEHTRRDKDKSLNLACRLAV